MTRRQLPFPQCWLFIPLLAAGLLLSSRQAIAQMTVTGPPGPAAHALTVWFGQHIPLRFQAHGRFEVQPLSDPEMEAYLHEADSDSDSDSAVASNDSDDDEIDGVFVDDPPKIILRVPPSGQVDFGTFAHEYGHYVWFELLSKDDRKRYRDLYGRQKAAHHLVSDYAAASVEEGFAEAFSADINDPVSLQHHDALSYQFLSRWTAAPPVP